MRVLQANLHRSRTADSLLVQLTRERNVDLLLISEQYRDKDLPNWYSDLLGTAAIWITEPGKFVVRGHGRSNGFVWITLSTATFFSCYLTPNQPIQAYRDILAELEDCIRRIPGQVVVGGDFNAKAVQWGMPRTDSRGRDLMELVARLNLSVLNVGNVSTFRRPGYAETIPDVSFASEALAAKVRGWRVLEDYSGSDHQGIVFDVLDNQAQRTNNEVAVLRWNSGRMDIERFCTVLGHAERVEIPAEVDEAVAEAVVASTMTTIVQACEASMPRKVPRHGKRSVYWWTAEIADLRRRCLLLRRRAQRARDQIQANLLSAEHREARRDLRRAINRSKALCWRKITEEVDSDPWGLGYKIVTKKLGAMRAPCVLEAAAMEHIVGTLFPTHPLRPAHDWAPLGDVPLFTREEVEKAIVSMKDRKAPGPDGVPSEVLRVVVQRDPELLVNMYNTCLKAGTFCSRWKRARLVLISKGKGDPGQPSAYRPLCMLDTAGKGLEKLIRSRLQTAIAAAGDLSPRQYGFRSGRSTVDAIQEVVEAVQRAEDHNHHSRRVVLLVTLDVKNAFNSAKWTDMLAALERSFNVPRYLMRIVDAYLRNRTLLYQTTEGQRTTSVTSGAAQGSILGPDLWNAAYDGLLRLDMPEEVRLVGYADDVAALVAARNVELAQSKLNRVMVRVNAWMSEHNLSLALDKTEIVILTKKRINTIIPMRIGEVVVQSKSHAKYLGVMIDNKLSFGEQVRCAAEKATKRVTALSRLMANTNGPSPSKRRLLMSSVMSVLLYGAEVWAQALSKECYRKQLARVQRLGALRIASAYRTVSEPAVMVLAGVVPVHLLARERQVIYRRRDEGDRAAVAAEERENTLTAWQASWEVETRSAWCRRLLVEIRPWINRKHGEVGYYLTQFFTGHGYFLSYLHRMGKTPSPDCVYCDGERDTAEHTFFFCGRWAVQRHRLAGEIGQPTPETIVGAMLRGKDTWDCVSHYIEGILRVKKDDFGRLLNL